jgi:hypothetical protein
VFYLIGFGMLAYGLLALRRSTQAAARPTTPATITNLEVRKKGDADGSVYSVEV